VKETLEELNAISPADFYNLKLELHAFNASLKSKLFRKSYFLPETADLLGEETFAEVAMGWSQDGVLFEIFVKKAFETSLYPEFRKGDSIELFLDTRDFKGPSFPGRFCHHFVILPKEVEGILCQEITRFRTEDAHPLSDGDTIKVESEFDKRDYRLKIFLPSHVLHGYDPATFDRLGFTYRINRSGGEPQHFSVSSKEYAIEQAPSLWSSLKLVK
jgi:hypothetical protein